MQLWVGWPQVKTATAFPGGSPKWVWTAEAPQRRMFTGPCRAGKQTKMVSSGSPSVPSPSQEQAHSLQATSVTLKPLFTPRTRPWHSTGVHGRDLEPGCLGSNHMINSPNARQWMNGQTNCGISTRQKIIHHEKEWSSGTWVRGWTSKTLC